MKTNFTKLVVAIATLMMVSVAVFAQENPLAGHSFSDGDNSITFTENRVTYVHGKSTDKGTYTVDTANKTVIVHYDGWDPDSYPYTAFSVIAYSHLFLRTDAVFDANLASLVAGKSYSGWDGSVAFKKDGSFEWGRVKGKYFIDEKFIFLLSNENGIEYFSYSADGKTIYEDGDEDYAYTSSKAGGFLKKLKK